MSTTEPRIEEALNECIERVLFNDKDLDECLMTYPSEIRVQLEPLLRIALAVQRVSAITPRPAFKAIAMERWYTTAEEWAQSRHRRYSWLPALRWALAASAAALLISLGSLGTIAAAASLPGEPLYTVKRAAEQVDLALATDPERRIELYLSMAERRLTEAQFLTLKGQDVPSWLIEEVGTRTLDASHHFAQKQPRAEPVNALEVEWLAHRLQSLNAGQQAVLSAVQERLEAVGASPQAQEALERAAERSQQGLEQAQEALQRERGKGNPKGSQQKPGRPETQERGDQPVEGPAKAPREAPKR